MRRTLAAVMIAAAAVSADAQTPASDAVKTELRAFLSELNAALQARDRAALERLYAPEFMFIHTIGPPVDRASHIANSMATAPRNAFPVPSLDDLFVIGDVAFLRTHEDARYSTTIYARRKGQWQVVQLQGTPIPSSRPSVSVTPELLRSYAGRYVQDNGLLVTIAVEGDALTLQGEGRQKFPLSALSQNQFTLPGNAGRITFAPDGTYEFQRANQPLIKATRR
jgi:ketosteroid isomerase-like protein